MKAGLTAALILCCLAIGSVPSYAQAPREDAIWARATNVPIVLDGVLDEPAWAKAESVIVQYGAENGIPGSGWKPEGGFNFSDPAFAKFKFLRFGDSLYVAAIVRDSSVGGSQDFNRFDGFLMDVKDHSNAGRPAPVTEHFYAWWDPEDIGHDTDPGKQPNFFGRWATYPPYLNPRTNEQITAFNAKTYVHGLSNSDAANDTGYTTEMRFDLSKEGYNLSKVGGEIVEWNVSVYDCDWLWLVPANAFRLNYGRGWWQDPWGNVAWYNEVRIHTRNDVTINSGPVPTIGPELTVPNGSNFASPVIDGNLNDAVWAKAPYFDIRFGDTALRDAYPAVGPYRSGQFQPTVNDTANAPPRSVEDPGNARFFYFFRDDSLFVGFNVNDLYVGNHPQEDRQDGFIVSVNDRVLRGADKNLKAYRIEFAVDNTPSHVKTLGDLPSLITASAARVALQLKPGTTVDTAGSNFDQGYTAELVLDLTKFGYAHGLGDHTLFFGVDYYDGDTFTDPTLSYATRTWWYRESDAWCCPVWAYMDPLSPVVGVDGQNAVTSRFSLLGNFPNPARVSSTIRYVIPEVSQVTLELYDARGRLVEKKSLGIQTPGERQAVVERPGLTGLHFYRLRFADPKSGSVKASLAGKVLLL